MRTNERFTPALLPSKAMSVETVEPVGIDESNTSSSSNTEDLIPEQVRKIFEGKQPSDFFRVYYFNEKEELFTMVEWLFEGRDKEYSMPATMEASGQLTKAIVVFQGRHKDYALSKKHRLVEGERRMVRCKGERIP